MAFEKIPHELRSYRQWVCHDANKMPLNPHTGKHASVTDPRTWGNYDEACSGVAAGIGVSIGFVLTENDPFTFIDLDVKEGEQPTAEQQAIYSEFDSYAELSPSGRGLHIIVRGKVPASIRQKGFEVYSSKRYMTVTGNAIRPGPVTDQSAKLQALWADMGGNASQIAQDVPSGPQMVSDDVILDRASKAANGAKFAALYASNWQSEYPSQSEADQALINIIQFYTKNREQIARIFRMSALGQRDKAKRTDYMNRMLAKCFDQELMPIAFNLPNQFVKPIESDELILRSMGTVKMKHVDYMWSGWIPKGYVTLVAGETGAAKTTVVADITARVTTGAPWPGEEVGRKPVKVMWLGSEDGIEDMTVPRLVACNANLNNIFEIQGIRHEGQRTTFSMQDHIEKIEKVLEASCNDECRFEMIVIDPITSYLCGQRLKKVDLNDSGQLRSILEPWLVVAQKYHIAIVCVTHFMKDTTRSMLHRVLGSAAFAQTCRSLIAVVERKDEQTPYAKTMIQVKTNLPEHPGGAWLFKTEKVQVGFDEASDKPIYATRPKWDKLESLVNLDNSVGSSGAHSNRGVTFGIWLNHRFSNVPPNEGLKVSDVKAYALEYNVVSDVWWNKHSGEYLDKRNINGVWQCRPKG
jgi:hypothetical protein